jgi:SET domain-containing protein
MARMKKLNNKYIKQIASRIQGSGIIAKRDIPAGTKIIQYVGERLTKRQSEKLLEKTLAAGKHIYVFTLNDKHDIDGDTDYNLAKYINHSCDPNCYPTNEDNEIWIVAKRDIKAGEELSYDYGFQRQDWQEHRCLCQAENCFGFIVAREHWAGIRKTKRYQKLTA